MLCYQCEQTAGGTGCTKMGVCGKDAVTAALQDLLVYQTKWIGRYAHRASQLGVHDSSVAAFIEDALFTTVTNVNFDPGRLQTLLLESEGVLAKARSRYESACRSEGKTPTEFSASPVLPLAADIDGLVAQGERIGIAARHTQLGVELTGLQELLGAGLKGMAAYAHHARILGKADSTVDAFFAEALDFLLEPNPDVNTLLDWALKCGEANLKTLAMLDAAHTATFGHPEPTPVRIHPLRGKAILVSGHDLKDLEALLQQTAELGINIYTHAEMLPAHAYPALKKYKHLAGNYGGAWQDQRKEFDAFPSAILMTTNCIQKPKDSYINRIFTCGLVAWPGVTHIAGRDFTPVIRAAQTAIGFPSDGPDQTIMVGFGHDAVMKAAGKVVDAVKSGALRRFFLIGGCDGAKTGRNYYTEFAAGVPKDCVILTLACGKYRFNKLEFGDIGGIPRLLDCGQCNDAYSAIQIALALANAFKCSVNELPLSLVLSWYEQKAVCILLTLLHLGIRNIRLGPSLPACLTPPVLKILIDKFNIMPIRTAAEDLKQILG